MKKFLAMSAGLFMLSMPTLAMADSIVPIQPEPEQLLARLAFLTAARDNQPIGCAVAASRPSVSLGETYKIWWGSYGADEETGWTPTGSATISPTMRGTFEYKFVFHGHGLTSTCRITVSVL